MNKLALYLRLVRADKPIGILLLLWPTLWALWMASGGHPDPLLRRDLRGRHRPDALERLRDQRLRRPRLRPPRQAHRRPAADQRPHQGLGSADGGGGAGHRVLPADPAAECADQGIVGAGRDRRRQLPVFQALLRDSPGLSRHRLRLRHPDGLRRRAGPGAGAWPGGCCWPTCSGRWPTTPSTRWSTATTTCKIGIRTSAITFGRYDVAAVMLCYAVALGIDLACGWHAGPALAGSWPGSRWRPAWRSTTTP